MVYRRGCKSEANATAREIRAELGLEDLDRLDPVELAEHLLAPVQTLSDLAARVGEAAAYLFAEEPTSFSAVTVFHCAHRLVVHNDSHHAYRAEQQHRAGYSCGIRSPEARRPEATSVTGGSHEDLFAAEGLDIRLARNVGALPAPSAQA